MFNSIILRSTFFTALIFAIGIEYDFMHTDVSFLNHNCIRILRFFLEPLKKFLDVGYNFLTNFCSCDELRLSVLWSVGSVMTFE